MRFIYSERSCNLCEGILDRTRLAEIPVKARHQGETLPGDLDWKMLVHRVLSAAWVGVGDPDGRQAEAIREDDVGQRAPEIRQDRGRFAQRRLDGAADPAHPGVVGVEAAGEEDRVV